MAGRHDGQHPFVALAIVLIAAFMILLDISIVNVAIPSIQRDLHASYAQIQFVLAGYQLSYAVVLITGGRLGDIVGRKLMFLIGVTGFTLASLLCGLSQSGEQIVGFRVFQGLMAALMYPQIFSIIQVAIPPQRRATAFGLFGATIGLATITGPLVGGLLIKLNINGLDWRPIFLINLPIGIGAVIAALIYLPESKAPNAPKLDLVGVAIVSLALFLVTFPLVEGRDAGWPWWTYAMLASSLVVFAIFAVFERSRERQGKDPLVALSLFKNRSFMAGVLLYFVFFSALPALFLSLTLWLQIGLGFDALKAGLTTIPFAVGSGIFSGVAARLVTRTGRNLLSVGGVVLVVGVLAVIFTAHQVGPGLSGPELIPSLFLCGVGLGLVVAPSINFILAAVDNNDAGSASGLITTVQQTGGAVGIAIIGVIFFGLIGSNADRITQAQAPAMRQQLVTGGIPAPLAEKFVSLYQVCFHDRSVAKDPSVNPASCKRVLALRATPQQLGITIQQLAVVGPRLGLVARKTFSESAVAARKADFNDTIQGSLIYNALAFALAFFLIFLLPSKLRPHGGPPGGAPGGVDPD
ncbi:MAG TPA: MFS transporter [Candidatus Dormibacteraeota bacterium]|nr:MFS transporter [Candidatus Dormibacteraeota bacterium]